MPVSTSEPSAKRDQVWRFIQRYPGTPVADVASHLGIAYSHAEYHVHQLERAGLVHRRDKACFPSEGEAVVDRRDQRVLVILRRPAPLRIVLALLDGAATNPELAKQVGIAPSSVSYHVRRLTNAGVVEREEQGRSAVFRLVDAEATANMLRSHPPKPNMADDLVAMLDSLG